MAQGKLKVKSKKPDLSAKKSKVSKAKTKTVARKKGRREIAPKKAGQKEVYNIQKALQKSIHRNIEEQMANRAKQVEEGKKFNVVNSSTSSVGKT